MDTLAFKEDLTFEYLVKTSKKFQDLIRQCQTAAGISVTGIVNLVVNYEDPYLVDTFLNACFGTEELYKGTTAIDAVELQQGKSGQGLAAVYIENLIYGSCGEMTKKSKDFDDISTKVMATDPQDGKRVRKENGFVSRIEVQTGECKEKLLVIRNLDYCMDFCEQTPGQIDARNLWIFDKFRNPSVKKGCRILLITNKPLKFPFKIRTINFEPVDEYDARQIIESYSQLFASCGFGVKFNESQIEQIVRKLCGLSYTIAAESFAEAISYDKNTNGKLDPINIVRALREEINKNLMEDAIGLTHLTPKPWADYICPESSNFTFDVKKITRDFDEINKLRAIEKNLISNNEDATHINKQIQAIRTRMPHIIILYGKGGVGKSAFPIHFAGLLDFDIWDYNINAAHNKFIGEGGERIREALGRISKASHLVVRIDEYDRAMGSTESGGGDMHPAHKQVEAEFMNWLQNSQEDNLFIKHDTFVIITTNHKENITGPLLRTGRADLVIDISNFDEKSMKEAFVSVPKRMANRGMVPPVGFDDFEGLSKAINELDLDKIAPIASKNGFTVRDIDVLIIEMAAHNYYHAKYQKGIPWTSEMFIKVLENSTGSTKDDNTCELVLGDRIVLSEQV